jgi:hypothetical protein
MRVLCAPLPVIRAEGINLSVGLLAITGLRTSSIAH